ncbi:cation:proton antiporter [Streptomyces sp. NPDC008265]|uniref:cation:proton antiporter domain-containing protein n=1 Tax=Streptomyces sp. NPDC008265 TaxID=3364824 RepID=UPI0036EB5A0D
MLSLPGLIRELGGEDRLWPVYALALAATLITVRILWIFPLSALLQWKNGKGRTNWRVPAVLSWAGTRGVMPLAAALSIPIATADGSPPAQRPLVLVLTSSVVVVTLVAQGFTLAAVVRRSGIGLEADHTEREETGARLSLSEAGLRRLDELSGLDGAPEAVLDRLRRALQARRDHAHDRLGDDEGPYESADQVWGYPDIPSRARARISDVRQTEATSPLSPTPSLPFAGEVEILARGRGEYG